MSELTFETPAPSSWALSTVNPVSRELEIRFHPGQIKAWDSTARIVLVLSGTQSGKTSFGPYWLAREIQMRGPGDYLVVSPTIQLMSKKQFPEFLKLFQQGYRWGNLTGRGTIANRFLFNPYGCRAVFGYVPDEPTQVFFGHAQDPDSLESATAKGVWIDEAGQKKFRVGSWEAIQRRGSIHQARTLITTTPYQLNWLSDLIYEPWRRTKAAGYTHSAIDVINFKSTENPAFPREEYERMKAILPAWKHRMFYDGEFTMPAGVIYDCFDLDKHVALNFPIPDNWPRYLGLDFGGVHTAGVFLAAELNSAGVETGRLFAYRDYPANSNWGSLTAKGHVTKLLHGEAKLPKAIGGAASEDQWRSEFRVAGLSVIEPPIKEVEIGIDRVYGTIKRDELLVFDTCTGLLDDLRSYSRDLDDSGNPTEKIADKEDFHFADALRYAIAYIKGVKKQFKIW